MKNTIALLLLVFSFQFSGSSQSFDTLNFIDNFTQYVSFLDTASTNKICHAFKSSKYFAHKIDRVFSKGYPQYAMSDEYYDKHHINEVDFVSYCEVDSSEDYLRMFAFYSPVRDSNYISLKLTNDGWQKNYWPPNVPKKEQKMLFRKMVNGENYIIENQRFPDDLTLRYFISFHGDEYGQKKLDEKNSRLKSIIQVRDSIANLVPIDTIKGIYYARSEDDLPEKYSGFWEYRKGGKLIQKASYVAGKINGEFTEYYMNGTIKAKNLYNNGSLEGEQLNYYEDGKLRERSNYKNMTADGLREVYWENGGVQYSAIFENGKQVGESKSYWENGQLLRKTQYENGKPFGEEIEYSNRGTILQKGSYKNGLHDGKWIHYYDDGTILSIDTYVNGELVQSE